MRQLLGLALALVAMAAVVSSAGAQDEKKKKKDNKVRGMLKKIDDKSITVMVRKSKEDKEGEEKTFTIDDKLTVKKGSFANKKLETADSSVKDLKEALEKNEKGLNVAIDVSEDGKKATGLTFTVFGKKKKDQ